MKIQISTQCFQYWKRLFWCLSSIYDQQKPIPEISIKINTCLEADNYRRFKKYICKNFQDKLNIEWLDWKKESGFALRGNVRNHDLFTLKPDIDWMLWIDSDIIFHPTHFNFLYNNLQKYENVQSLLSLLRVEVPLEISEKIINAERYNHYVRNSVLKTGLIDSPIIPERRARAVGFYQLVSTKTLKEKRVKLYSKKLFDASVFSDEKHRTFSEQEFRRKVGAVIFENCPNVYHLDHLRQKEKFKLFDTTCL